MRDYTATQLFALARGAEVRHGPHRCWFCGGSCDDTYPAEVIVKDRCTVFASVAAPGSDYVCGGCVAAHDEHAEVTLVDGEVRPDSRVRLYSWYVDTERALALVAARHRDDLERLLLDETAVCVPYALCITTRGQRHHLYETPVCLDLQAPVCTLDGEVLYYDRAALREALRYAEMISASLGRLALTRRPRAVDHLRLFADWGALAEEAGAWWRLRWRAPEARLAAVIVRPKEECRERYARVLDAAVLEATDA